MLTDIPKFSNSRKDQKAGTWRRILFLAADGFHWSAVVWCPDCAKPMSLVNHTITPDGKVSPSVGHPESYAPCPWHTHVTLLGWRDDPIPPAPEPQTCQNCGFVSRCVSGWGTWSGGTGIICGDCFKARMTAHQPAQPESKT